MVAVYTPSARKAQGTKKQAFVLSIATLTAPKIATEIKATSSVEGTLALRGFDPVNNTNTGNSPARLGTTTQLPQEGNTTLGAIPLAWVSDPSLPLTDPANKLGALLVPGLRVYSVVRRGSDIYTDWTVGDLVDVFYGQIGFVDDDQKSGDDEFAEYETHCFFTPLAAKTSRAVLAA